MSYAGSTIFCHHRESTHLFTAIILPILGVFSQLHTLDQLTSYFRHSRHNFQFSIWNEHVGWVKQTKCLGLVSSSINLQSIVHSSWFSVPGTGASQGGIGYLSFEHSPCNTKITPILFYSFLSFLQIGYFCRGIVVCVWVYVSNTHLLVEFLVWQKVKNQKFYQTLKIPHKNTLT